MMMSEFVGKAADAAITSVAKHPLIASFVTFGALVVGLNNPLWTDKVGAAKAVASAGLTSVETGGYRWLSCDRNDRFRTGFTAINAQGERVTGAVCSGFFKGNTLRFN
jgi:hypothetical protein